MTNPQAELGSGFAAPTALDTAYMVPENYYIDSHESFQDEVFNGITTTHSVSISDVFGSFYVEIPQSTVYGYEATVFSIIIESHDNETFHLYKEIGAYPPDGEMWDESYWGGALHNRNADFSISIIPEPSTYALIIGGVALGFVALRRK